MNPNHDSKGKFAKSASSHADRAEHYANKAVKAAEKHAAATTPAEKSKHALVVAHSLKKAEKHAAIANKAADKDPSGQADKHAARANDAHAKAQAAHVKVSGEKSSSPLDKLTSASKTKTTGPKTKSAHHANRAEHYAAKAEKAAKSGTAADKLIAAHAAKKAASHAKLAAKKAGSGDEEHVARAQKAAEAAHKSAGLSAPKIASSPGKAHQEDNHGLNGKKGDGEEMSSHTFSSEKNKFASKLTSEEKSAILAYSGSAYVSINSHLRTSKGDAKNASSGTREYIKHMDSALAKSAAPHDLLVHRGAGGEKAAEKFAGMKPGDTFTEHGYSSTSAAKDSAFGGKVKFQITVPKGSPAAVIPSHHAHEKEILLPRDTKFKVTGSHKEKSKFGGSTVLVMHVTVV